MGLDINREMEIDNLAKRFLQAIIENCLHPKYLSKYHKYVSKHCDEFEKEFEKSLSNNQKEDYRTLTEIQNFTAYFMECRCRVPF